MQPVDFSGRQMLRFRVRGDGRSYLVMLFSGGAPAAVPPSVPFTAPEDWTVVAIPLASFPTATPGLVAGLAFVATTPAGVRGYLLKDAPADELARAVRDVRAGRRAIAPELAAEAWCEADPLTDRERQVLRLAGEGGLSGARIAASLALSEGTVRNYLSEAIGKLGASNRVEAARIARQKGWL